MLYVACDSSPFKSTIIALSPANRESSIISNRIENVLPEFVVPITKLCESVGSRYTLFFLTTIGSPLL